MIIVMKDFLKKAVKISEPVDLILKSNQLVPIIAAGNLQLSRCWNNIVSLEGEFQGVASNDADAPGLQ